jgi:uridine kinase
LIHKKNTIIIGIAGASGSGKSLLANTIVNELGSDQVVIISEDSYYKDRSNVSFAERAKINYDHPDAFDHDLLYEHLQQLQQGNNVAVPIYDHALHVRENATYPIGRHTIVVLEGILILSEKKLRDMMDMRIFVETSLDICLIRRLKRDIKERGRSLDAVLAQYEETVRPMYLQFVDPSKRDADIIVPHGGGNRIAIDLIKAEMRELLR